MSIVTEISWEHVADPAFGGDRQPSPDLEAITRPEREAFRAAVASVADKAKAKLPESSSRVEKAVALVLAGDVTLQPDGSALVGSQCAPDTVYHVASGQCSCKDFAQAPHQFCKHRLATAIHQRALSLSAERSEPLPSAAEKRSLPALVGAPLASPPRIPEQYLVKISGKPFVTYAGLLAMAHARGLERLSVTWTYNDATLSLATAQAVFPFGSFEECGDASPDNVTKKVSPHFRRMALTRAKARVLRDALGIDVVSLEELAE